MPRKPKVEIAQPKMSLDEAIARIRAAHRARWSVIKLQRMTNLACLSRVRSVMNWHSVDPEEREKLKKQSQEIVDRIEKGDVDGIDPWVVREVTAAIAARQPYDAVRKDAEKQMEQLARLLPGWSWMQNIRGLAEGTLAMIVGEAGNLSDYANPAKLWKRMGLAVIGGKAQGKPGTGATAEDWIAHGYNAERRSKMFNVAEAIVKAQGEPYASMIIERKKIEHAKAIAEGLIPCATSKTTADNWAKLGLVLTVVKKADPTKHRTAAHMTRRAGRYVEKRILRDLWRAWRREDPGSMVVVNVD